MIWNTQDEFMARNFEEWQAMAVKKQAAAQELRDGRKKQIEDDAEDEEVYTKGGKKREAEEEVPADLDAKMTFATKKKKVDGDKKKKKKSTAKALNNQKLLSFGEDEEEA